MNNIPSSIGTRPAVSATASPHSHAGRMPPNGMGAMAVPALTATAEADSLLQSSGGLPLFGNQSQLQPGLPTLFALLQQLPPALMAQLPPRTAALLEKLQRQVLGSAELGDFRRVKHHLLELNGMAETDPSMAAPDAAGATGQADDLKALLLQLLHSLQAGRRLLMKDGLPAFTDAAMTSAYCLQAYADEQSEGTPWKRLRALLNGNLESAVLGIVQGELQAGARSDEKISRWIMHLLLRQRDDTLAVPVLFSREAEPGGETWEVEFDLDLRQLGRLHVVIAVKNTAVAVSLTAATPEARQLLNQRLALGQRLESKGLTLSQFSCQRSGRD